MIYLISINSNCSIIFTKRFLQFLWILKKNKKCYRPKINKKVFYNKIKMYLVGSNKTSEDAIKNIVDKNNAYGMRSRKKLLRK